MVAPCLQLVLQSISISFHRPSTNIHRPDRHRIRLNPPVPLKEIESGQRNHSYYEVDIISSRGGFPNDEK